ncbi:helicase [Alphabaculovirus altermyunipunctae]|uniref:Helicase n=1 Tax=Mythimna unipuncta nucleopolyhedrovirus TaxID=447897 RepID=A0A346TPM5_9ABAC|nr:helicase [Mythimna unipuncta nucleopolyhedrovirus]AXU41535.1 helicase [Mythimna unipuncta nucleopolyhedrovirus]
MTAYPISTDNIFDKILDLCEHNDRDGNVDDLTRLDRILFQNASSREKRCLKSYENFKKLITIMSDDKTEPAQLKHDHSHRSLPNATPATTALVDDIIDFECDIDDYLELSGISLEDNDVQASVIEEFDCENVSQHDWFVHGNYFAMKIRPFVRLEHYDAIKDEFDFENFVVDGDANECRVAGEYVYWPNVAVSYFGWRIFIKFRTGIDIGTFIPIVNNRSLGNVNLFVFQAKYFVSVELMMTLKTPETTLFVNGTSNMQNLTQNDQDELFYVTTTNGSVGVCKIINNLVYSNKDIFEYIVDDIHLESCETNKKYADMFRLDVGSMRTYDSSHHATAVGTSRTSLRPKLSTRRECSDVITASSEHRATIEKCINESVAKIIVAMQEALSRYDIADEFVLCRYFDESEFVNFDYIIMAVWKCVRQESKFEYRETDIKLYIELLCKRIFGHRPALMDMALECCAPYFQLTKPVFKRLCADMRFFCDSSIELAHFYAVHYAISMKQRELGKTDRDLWTYTLDTAVASGIDQNVLCNGYVKKLTVQSTHSIFNGKHYTVVKKDDDLLKITDKTTPYNVSNLKFNSWKYLYLTEHGVFNVIKMTYHDSCPFIVGNCLIKSFVDRKDNDEFASKSLLDYMLKNIKYEVSILKVYHVAKLARDLKVLKKNVAMIMAFNTCADCKTSEKLKLNKLFREIWNMDRHECVMLGVYLNVHKINDLRLNMRCSNCINARSNGSACDCVKDADIDFAAFKVALAYSLFSENSTVIEMAWALLYDKKQYGDTLKCVLTTDERFVKYIDVIQANRSRIVRRLYDRFDRTDFIFDLIDMSSDPNRVEEDMVALPTNLNAMDEVVRDVDALTCQQSMPNFFQDFMLTVNVLKQWRVWWDKLIVARPDDDLFKWLLRFYMRIIMSKVDTSSVSPYFLRMLVHGYLYFRVFTNFNDTNSLLMMHFTASLAIPNDYEKLCIYLNGESNCGKSSFFDLLDTIIVAHKRDSAVYNTTKKETDEMEANKLISQLYVINEMKECNDAFFKNSADSSKSNSVCRKYEGSQKYEANYKLLIVNNKPLCIRDYDKGVRNRFCVVYMKHVFVENLPFSGSVYDHYKNGRYPMEKGYYETLKNPVRIFAAHILKYKRNPRNGYVYYKCLVNNDPIQKHNLMCLDLNNHPFSALVYILKIKPQPGAYIEECRVDAMISEALPHLEKFCHPLLKRSYNEHKLGAEFRNVYSKYYRPAEKLYVGLTMARNLKEFNLNIPTFMC